VRLRDLLDEAIARARADLETRLKKKAQRSEDFIAAVAHGWH